MILYQRSKKKWLQSCKVNDYRRIKKCKYGADNDIKRIPFLLSEWKNFKSRSCDDRNNRKNYGFALIWNLN